MRKNIQLLISAPLQELALISVELSVTLLMIGHGVVWIPEHNRKSLQFEAMHAASLWHTADNGT